MSNNYQNNENQYSGSDCKNSCKDSQQGKNKATNSSKSQYSNSHKDSDDCDGQKGGCR